MPSLADKAGDHEQGYTTADRGGNEMMEPSVLFQVAFRGRSVSVGHATDAELALLAGAVATVDARDELDTWSLIAIRDTAGCGTKLHALGWRAGLLNTWITSPLVTVDLAANTVSTTSGHAYLLGRRDARDLHPVLHGHLAYALRTWGFDDVPV
jgi:hypothetical protein